MLEFKRAYNPFVNSLKVTGNYKVSKIGNSLLVITSLREWWIQDPRNRKIFQTKVIMARMYI